MSTEREEQVREDAPRAESAAASGPMGRRGHRPSRWALFHATKSGRAARMSTFVAVLLGVGTWLTYSRTTAQLGDDLLGAGASLLRMTENDHESGPRIIRINGESVHVVSGSTERPLDEMMDEFESVCLERDAQFTEQMHDFAAANPENRRSAAASAFSPVFRRQNGEDRGVVACLDLGTDRRTSADLLESWTRFRENGDLHEIGDIRYVFVEAASSGRTHFVSLWTEGSFHVNNILPANTDAPGEDIAGLPRPPRSRRTLSAWQEGRDERFLVYEGSSMTEWELDGWYRTALRDEGWSVLDAEVAEGSESMIVMAMRDGRQLYVSLDTDEYGDGTATLMLTE